MRFKGIVDLVNELSTKKYTELSDEAFNAELADRIPDDYNQQIAQQYEVILSRNVPDYKPLAFNERRERRNLHDKAVENFASAVRSATAGSKNVPGFEELDRGYQALFYGIGNTPEEIAKKKEMAQILRIGTVKEKHDLFLDAMEKMASFPMEDFRAMIDEQKLENLSEYLPVLLMGMEGEGMLTKFKSELGDRITPDVEKRFTELYTALAEEGRQITQKTDMFLSPYYSDIDPTKIPDDNSVRNRIREDAEALNNRISDAADNSVRDLLEAGNRFVSQQAADRHHDIEAYFKDEDPTSEAEHIMLCDKDGKRLSDNEADNKYLDRAREGETVYFKNNRNNTVMAFRDFEGKGVLTKIPDEFKNVSKPNGFVLFFDSISRAIRGKGLESVEKYNRYQTWVREARTADHKRSALEKFDRSAKAVKSNAAQRRIAKAAAKKAQNEIRNAAPETNAQKAERLANKFLREPEELTTPEKIWISENPRAVRDGFRKIQDDLIKAPEQSAEQAKMIDECGKNIVSLENVMQRKAAKESSPQRQGSERVNEPEQPKKQRSAGV